MESNFGVVIIGHLVVSTICLTHYRNFNTMVQSHLQLVTSGESRLDASSLKLKWECYNDVNYSRWSCGFNYVIVSRL